MRITKSFLCTLLPAFAFLALEPSAFAADPAAPATADNPPQREASGARPLTLEWNPLMAIGGTVSLNVEYVPVTHLGVVASPQIGLTSSYFGGEVGAHYWTNGNGQASGFFIGPSAIYGNVRGDSYVGAALDLGGQAILSNGLTLGAGAGVEYLSLGDTGTGPIKLSSAVLPRLLFSVGYSL